MLPFTVAINSSRSSNFLIGRSQWRNSHLDGLAVEIAREVQQMHLAGGGGAVGERGGHAHVHGGFVAHAVDVRIGGVHAVSQRRI